MCFLGGRQKASIDESLSEFKKTSLLILFNDSLSSYISGFTFIVSKRIECLTVLIRFVGDRVVHIKQRNGKAESVKIFLK